MLSAAPVRSAPSISKRPRAALAAVLVAFVALLAACGVVSAILDTQRALGRAGYSGSVSVNQVNGFVTATATESSSSSSASTQEVATIVWKTFPRRIDSIVVILNGDESAPFTRGRMTEIAGPRPAGLDDKTFGDDAKGVVIGW